MVDKLNEYKEAGYKILVLTARREKYYNQTLWWLLLNDIHFDWLLMRPHGDSRSDYQVKEARLKQIQKAFHVERAFEDNPTIVNLLQKNNINVTVIPGWDGTY